MVKNWSYVTLEPRSGERSTLLSAVDAFDGFDRVASHDGEVVCVAPRGDWFADDLLESVAAHAERATLLWTTDEGPEVSGRYFEHDDGELVTETIAGGTSIAAVADYFAREHGIHGPR